MQSVLKNTSLRISSFVTRIENIRWLSKVPKKSIRPVLLVLALLILGAVVYFSVTALRSNTTAQATAQPLQTTVVRQGDLVIYASGTGTLIADNQVDLAFKTGGQISAINVKVGDQVKAGDVLAQIDDASVQIAYTQAKRNLLELTSVSAIASAQEAMATATTSVQTAINHLQYIISPNVYHWENEVATAEAAVKDAQAKATAAPSDKDAQATLKKAQDYLTYAKASLVSAQYSYTHDYIPRNFTVKKRDPISHLVTKYVAAPTDADILAARAGVTQAKANLQEATYLYNALTGGEVPDDATGSGLTALEQAKLALQSAQNDLNGISIVAPFSGTVMAVNSSVGDTVNNSTAIITLADLSQPSLNVYLDASDWNNVKVGNDAEVTFDNLPDTKFTGKVTQVDPGLSTQSGSSVIHAVVSLENNSDPVNLPIGATAAVDVIGGQARNAVLVPVAALHHAGDSYTVFVVENGKLKLRVVKIGIQDLTFAEVKSGLNAGDVVSTGIEQTGTNAQTSTP